MKEKMLYDHYIIKRLFLDVTIIIACGSYVDINMYIEV